MSDPRETAYFLINRLATVPDSELAAAARDAIAPDAVWSMSAPVGDLVGPDAVVEGWLKPLRAALGHVHRRDEIFIGAANRLDPGEDWVAALTHYVGAHRAPLWGIEGTGGLVFLRSGEFYRISNGQISEAKLIVDSLDLMRQAGRYPLPQHLGTEMLFPGPATHDGVLPSDRSRGEASLDVVEGMARDLHVFDPETYGSDGQTGMGGYWAPDFLWYGPGGIGASFRWEGFIEFHRKPFLDAFPDRKGGNHYARIGDGNFAAFSGWPSMTMTHAGDYLGVPATGRALTLNVMDFYRIQSGQIAENWVCLDYVGLFQQMGVDVIAMAAA